MLLSCTSWITIAILFLQIWQIFVVSRSFKAQVLHTPACPQGMNTLSQGALQQIRQSFTELSESVLASFLSFLEVYKVELILDKVIVALTVLKILLIECPVFSSGKLEKQNII